MGVKGAFDLLEIVLLREVHRQLPLVQQDTPWRQIHLMTNDRYGN